MSIRQETDPRTGRTRTWVSTADLFFWPAQYHGWELEIGASRWKMVDRKWELDEQQDPPALQHIGFYVEEA